MEIEKEIEKKYKGLHKNIYLVSPSGLGVSQRKVKRGVSKFELS